MDPKWIKADRKAVDAYYRKLEWPIQAMAKTLDRIDALLYRAELAVRLDKSALAKSSLAAARALKITPRQKALIAEELAQTSELVAGK